MTLRKLSYKEIKTIYGGTGYEFPITSFFIGEILGTAYNLKNLTIAAVNATVGLFMFNVDD